LLYVLSLVAEVFIIPRIYLSRISCCAEVSYSLWAGFSFFLVKSLLTRNVDWTFNFRRISEYLRYCHFASI